jgi:hypothetical protein
MQGVAQTIGPEKKIISGGADNRTADYVRQNIEAMERVPFDGVCINVYTKKDGNVQPVNLRVMDPNPIRFEDFSDAIADLKATKFTRFKNNFLWVWISPDPGAVSLDFFDDRSAMVNNWKVAAKIAKEGGYRGLFVDTEQYDTQWGPFAWTRVKYSSTKTQEEYAAQAKLRGTEVMCAMNDVYPDIHILWFFGYSASGPRRPRVGAYAFVPDFIDGMLAAAKPDARIIDGYEQSYGYKTKPFFSAARDLMKNEMESTSPLPEKFKKQHEAGFGIWLDCHGTALGWNPGDYLKNYFTPKEFEYSLHQALAHTDEYVWIWFERGSFWTGANVPWPYFNALTEARKPHPDQPKSIPKNPPEGAPEPLKIGGYDGEKLEALLGNKYAYICDLPRRWPWRPDPREKGFEEKWYAPELDDASGWRPLLTGIEMWEGEGYKYECASWYRLRYDVPPLPYGKQVYLCFESVNEVMWIWINGRLVESKNVADAANGKPLLVNVTGLLRSNIQDLIVIRRQSGLEPGGAWRSVKLAVES